MRKPKFEYYKDKKGEWRWRLKGTNGEIVCWSEGYLSKEAVLRSIKWVKQNAPDAEVVEIKETEKLIEEKLYNLFLKVLRKK